MMNSPNRWQRWLSLGLPFPLVVLNGWLALQVFQYFQPLVTIFVLTTLLAFILNYPVQFLQRRGVGRKLAVTLVFLLTLVILVTFGITFFPLLLEEFSEIAKVLPQWIASGNQKLQVLNYWAEQHNLPINLSQLISQIAERMPSELQSFAKQILSVFWSAVDSVSEVVLIGVLTLYLLLDGERLWEGIFQRLPSSFGSEVQQSLQQNFQNYFIGQIALASLVGLSMTLVFLVLKIPFGLLFGVGIGLFSLIPFGDVFGFSLVSLLVASQDLLLGIKTLVVVILVDQTIDQVIAPRILGSFTGLSPVWVLVSLVVGTKIGGLLGLLIAVPLAGFIKSTVDSLDAKISSTSVVNLGSPPTKQSNSCEQG
jgi:predicted PurR-regulated permease PerM